MNSKLIEFRDYYTQLQDSAMQQSAFKEGFNMALELNLAKNFFEWTTSKESQEFANKFTLNVDLDSESQIIKLANEAYDYWINNIFTPIYK